MEENAKSKRNTFFPERVKKQKSPLVPLYTKEELHELNIDQELKMYPKKNRWR